jgi:hypothetical protein
MKPAGNAAPSRPQDRALGGFREAPATLPAAAAKGASCARWRAGGTHGA